MPEELTGEALFDAFHLQTTSNKEQGSLNFEVPCSMFAFSLSTGVLMLEGCTGEALVDAFHLRTTSNKEQGSLNFEVPCSKFLVRCSHLRLELESSCRKN